MSSTDIVVGRSTEIELLDRSLNEAAGGQRRIVLISGEPGIGKTTLAHEIARRAADLGASVHWGRAWESGGSPPLWPWVQILRAGFSHDSVPEIRRAIPGPTEILEELVTGAPSSEPEQPGSDSRFAIFDAVAQFLHALAKHQPLVLILEDVHASDPSSLHLMNFVAKARPDSNMMLLATFRHAEAESRPEIDNLLADIEREGRRIHLTGLAPEDCATLVRSVRKDSSELDGAELQRITGGNPLYLRQISRASEDVIQRDVGVRSAIRRHIGMASEAITQLLSLASVIGRNVEIAFLVEMSRSDGAEVRAILGRAASEGFIRLANDRDEFSFSHDLVRQALYEGLGEQERVDLHRRAAQLLEKMQESSPDGRITLIARHFAAAMDGPKAVDYLLRSAELALRRFAYESAVEDLEQALGFVDQADLDTRADILIRLGDARRRSVGQEDGRQALLEAAELADASGDPVRYARAFAAMGETSLPAIYARDEVIVEGLERSLEMLPSGNDHLRVKLLANLTYHLNAPAEQPKRERSRAEALELATELGDEILIGESLRAWLGSLLYESTDGLEMCQRLLDHVEPLKRTGDAVTRLRAHELSATAWRFRSTYLLQSGDVLGFERAAAKVIAISEELRQPRYLMAAECIRTVRAYMLGRLEESLECADRTLQHMPNELLVVAMHVVQRSWALFEQGRLHEMEELTESLVAGLPDLLGLRLLLALGRAQDARVDEATATAGPLLTDPGVIPRDAAWELLVGGTAMLARELNRADTCRTIGELLRPSVGRHGVINTSQPGSYMRPISYFVGLCDATVGDHESASALFQQAIAESEEVGAPLAAAWARYELACVCAATGDTDAARTWAGSAKSFAGPAGMGYLSSKIDSLLGSISEVVGQAVASEIRRDGDVWQIRTPRTTFRVTPVKGIDYLVRLLESPGKELHALELAGASGKTTSGGRAAANDLRTSGAKSEVVDQKALAQYKRRVEELREEIEDAESNSDSERASRSRAELDFLLEELASITGIGGRARSFSDPAEKARVAVTKSIRRAIDRLGEHDDQFAEFLRRSVTTGVFCSYQPIDLGDGGQTVVKVIR